MGIPIIGGVSGIAVGSDVEAAKPLHGVAKPQPYGAAGHYAAILTTGTIAAGMAALGELVQMRWVSATHFCLIHEIQVREFRNVATAWTAGRFLFDTIISTAWSADGTGGNAVSVAANQLMLRKLVMSTSKFSTGFRLATTAALGAGTKTFDTLPFGSTFGHVDAVAVKGHIPQSNVVTTAGPNAGEGIMLFKCDLASGEHPIVLSSNGGSTSEGISIRATVPATGTWAASFLVKWAEVTAF